MPLDGKRIAFVRRAARARDTPEGYFIERIARIPGQFGMETLPAAPQKKSGAAVTNQTIRFHTWRDDTGGGVINWAANDTIVMASRSRRLAAFVRRSPQNGGRAEIAYSRKFAKSSRWSFTSRQKKQFS